MRYPEKDPLYLHLQQLEDKNPNADYHAAMSNKYELAWMSTGKKKPNN